MSYRCKPKSTFNLDVLAKECREVYKANFDHPSLGKCLHYLSQCTPTEQNTILTLACGCKMSYEQFCNCARSKFVIQRQKDTRGEFSALTFGDSCVSVATWDGHSLPLHAEEVDVTEICYKDTQGNLRCSPMLDFAELWMEQNQSSFRGFLSGIDIVNV